MFLENLVKKHKTLQRLFTSPISYCSPPSYFTSSPFEFFSLPHKTWELWRENMGKIIFFPRTTRALSYGRGRTLKKIQKCEIFLARTRMQRWQEYLNLKTISEMLWKYGTFLVMTRMQRWAQYPHLKQSMMFIWRFPRLCSLEHLISWRLSVVLFFILENSFLRSFIWCIVGRMFSISIEKWKNMVLVLED